ncbi:MAG: uridine kinase [Bacteroidia bacterium]|nr:uridine kinase [Bacteroidia bacterium]MDW8157693.1 uridine kinase [Bacteroidia bacterium]
MPNNNELKNRPYIVGISGGSASGKTYVLKRLEKSAISPFITLISQDNYYKDLHEQELESDGNVNFDHPKAFNEEIYYEHIRKLIDGQSVKIREYHFNKPNAEIKFIEYKPAPIIIIEGLFVFYFETIAQLMDLKVFIEADEHIKFARRIKRDYKDRGYEIESIIDQYVNYVVPMYRKFVEPYKWECDIIIPNNRHLQTGVTVLINHLKWILQEKDIIKINPNLCSTSNE